jgi:hypothetical protein
VDVDLVCSILSNEKNVTVISDYSFNYEVPQLRLRALIYLEKFNETTDNTGTIENDIDDDNISRVNCVLICVPYAFKHADNRDWSYVSLGLRIAKELGWELYDEQSGEYITA